MYDKHCVEFKLFPPSHWHFPGNGVIRGLGRLSSSKKVKIIITSHSAIKTPLKIFIQRESWRLACKGCKGLSFPMKFRAPRTIYNNFLLISGDTLILKKLWNLVRIESECNTFLQVCLVNGISSFLSWCLQMKLHQFLEAGVVCSKVGITLLCKQ